MPSPSNAEFSSKLATILFVGAMAAMPNAAYAQGPGAHTFPPLPEICHNEQAAKTPEQCVREDWPTFEEAEGYVIVLYRHERFVELELALEKMMTSKKRFASGKSPAAAAYWAFRRSMAAPGVGPSERDRIARWRKSFPRSYFATFAEARYLYAMAWNARGSGYAGNISPESWELFDERLTQAEQILLDAPSELQKTPLWHSLLLAISVDTKVAKSKPQTVFTNAVKAWPDYYDFYEVMLTRLVPKWGGSWEQVDAFINHWAKEQASREGTSLYARLYASLRTQGLSPGETKMDWSKMKASFVDLETRYPDSMYRNLFASYACFARDREAFAEAMQKVSDRLLPQHWLPGYSHDACMRWAVV